MKNLCLALILLFQIEVFAADAKKEKKTVQTQVVAPKKVEKNNYDGAQLCLVSMYAKQVKYFKANGKYVNSASELEPEKDMNCKNVDLNVNMTTDTEFKMQAQMMLSTWTIDQNKSLEKIK